MCRWRSLVCTSTLYIFLQDPGPTEWPTIANSSPPPSSSLPPPRREESGSLPLPPPPPSSPPPPPLSLFPFYFSRFNRFLPLFTVLLLAPRHPPSPPPPPPSLPPGSAASAIDDFFKQQRILIAVLSPQILAIITGGQWGRSDTSPRPRSVRIKFSVRNSLKIIFPEI